MFDACNRKQFICTSQCYRENTQSTKMGHIEKDRYYAKGCICSMMNPSQKSVVNENGTHETRDNMDLTLNVNRPKSLIENMKKIF